jgi:hypothetical protein
MRSCLMSPHLLHLNKSVTILDNKLRLFRHRHYHSHLNRLCRHSIRRARLLSLNIRNTDFSLSFPTTSLLQHIPIRRLNSVTKCPRIHKYPQTRLLCSPAVRTLALFLKRAVGKRELQITYVLSRDVDG